MWCNLHEKLAAGASRTGLHGFSYWWGKAVKRKYEELSMSVPPVPSVQENKENVAISGISGTELDLTALALKASDPVREEAQEKLSLCCDTCGTSFQDNESLKRHIQKKHPRSTGSLESGPITE